MRESPSRASVDARRLETRALDQAHRNLSSRIEGSNSRARANHSSEPSNAIVTARAIQQTRGQRPPGTWRSTYPGCRPGCSELEVDEGTISPGHHDDQEE